MYSLLSPKTDIVVDKVQVVARRDGHGVTSPLQQPAVGLVQGLVHVHKGVHNGLAMSGRLGKVGVGQGVGYGGHVLWEDKEVNEKKGQMDTLTSDLSKSTLLVNSYPT